MSELAKREVIDAKPRTCHINLRNGYIAYNCRFDWLTGLCEKCGYPVGTPKE